jgi:teichuronic acid biosynthesis glycosyltransferase TuaG
MKLVSIIIPYYKKRRYIFRAVQSVLKQSYRKYEIIIVYNDKDKKDLNYILNIKKKDKRIKVFEESSKKGAGYSRNIAIKKSKGDFIAFLDSDDEWKKNKLQIQLNFMQKNSCLVSHTSYEIINYRNKVIGFRKAKKKLVYADLLKSCDIGLSTVMVNKKVLFNQKFPNIKTKEDYILWLKLTKKNIKILGINIYLTKWRKLTDALSSNNVQKIIDGFRVYNIHMKFGYFKSLIYLIRLSINSIIKKI